jgi:hypothetical protein
MIRRWDFLLVQSLLLSLLSLSRYANLYQLRLSATPSTLNLPPFNFKTLGSPHSHLAMKTIILLLAVVATTFAMRELTLSRLFFLPTTLTLYLQHPTSSIEGAVRF